MRLYTTIVSHDTDGSFGMAFPDMQGCFAASDSWEGISAAAAEAIGLWFEDQPDVTPASLDEIRQRADVIAAITEGAALMLIPYVPTHNQQGRPSYEKYDALARAMMDTRPDLEPMSLDEWVIQHHDKLTPHEWEAAVHICNLHQSI